MDRSDKAMGKLDKRNLLTKEAMQQLVDLHRPKATIPPCLGDQRHEGGQLFEKRKIVGEMMKERQGWAGERQLSPSQRGETFCWSSFLPQRKLTILLVETDDSTRLVLSALLRNCNYEVLSVANGLQAWDVLENSSNRVDMVLTEVVMQGLSGIALLRRIIAHPPCRNVPVIMMSSNDSMGLVVSCLTNGAADFLLKPVRKNELSNLWQHVWRMHHSSHGNKDQNGSPHLMASKYQKNGCKSDIIVADGGDDASETESSLTKPIRVEESPGLQKERICAHIPRYDPMFASGASEVNQATSPDIPSSAACRYENKIPVEAELSDDIGKTGSLVINGKGKDVEDLTPVLSERESKKSIDFFGILARQETSEQEQVSRRSSMKMDDGKNLVKSCIYRTTSDSTLLPYLELSLKRQGAAGELESLENRPLKRSISSAFSRYKSQAHSSQPPLNMAVPDNHAAMVSDNQSSLTENRTKMESTPSLRSDKNDEMAKSVLMCNPIVRESDNHNAAARPTVANGDDFPNTLLDDNPTSSVIRSAPWSNHTSIGTQIETPFHSNDAMQSQFYTHSIASPNPVYCSLVNTLNVCEAGALYDPVQSCITHDTHHPHMKFQLHSHHQQQDLPQKKSVLQQSDEQAGADVKCGTPQRGQSILASIVEGNNNCRSNSYTVEWSGNNRSNNGFGNGSHNESDPANNNTHFHVHEKTDDLIVMQPTHGVFIDSNFTYGRTGIDTGDNEAITNNGGIMTPALEQNPSVREAALSKFRQKRKERCFQKKIRYLSRKVLAEQRPRVRGQFVRQAVCVPSH